MVLYALAHARLPAHVAWVENAYAKGALELSTAPERTAGGDRAMASNNAFRIAVLPGDGIGREVMPPAVEIAQAAARRVGGFALDFEWLDAGAGTYQTTGTA
ncbi:MAG TPA: hypothetical protein VK001_12375, partial [Geminicoccaceae bacterium]|nr:hypothetical protein [Geminicoccaceae bacterium]